MTKEPLIPFNRPTVTGLEASYMAQALESGHISGGGSMSTQAQKILSDICGSPNTLLTTNCTHALELAARILRLGPGDEVIVPAYTFVSTASAFALTGARPVFVDVDDQTLNLDIDLVKDRLTSNTRAICTVYYAGIGNRVDELSDLAASSGIDLIEDNAHGLGGRFKGQLLGTFGSMSAMSFHETKNITCGEGGALGINDAHLLQLAEILREKGTDRSQFFRGQVDKYTWREIGSSWVLSDLLAGYLLAQLENFNNIQEKRLAIWNTYNENLESWATRNNVRRPFVPMHSEHTGHMYFLRLPNPESRTRLIAHLREKGVMAVFHYQALNESSVGRSLGSKVDDCPVAVNAAETLVRLPLFTNMSEMELERVIDATLNFEVN